MSSDDERINCKKCGTDTNHCPPEFPPEWDGFCPDCAMASCEAGKIPRCSIDAMLGQLVGRLNQQLGGVAEVHIIAGDQLQAGTMLKIAEDESGATFVTRQCLN